MDRKSNIKAVSGSPDEVVEVDGLRVRRSGLASASMVFGRWSYTDKLDADREAVEVYRLISEAIVSSPE